MKISIFTALALAAVSVQAQNPGASKNVALPNSRSAAQRTTTNANAAPPNWGNIHCVEASTGQRHIFGRWPNLWGQVRASGAEVQGDYYTYPLIIELEEMYPLEAWSFAGYWSSALPWLGAMALSPEQAQMGPGSPNFGVFTFTDVTPVGAGPANGPTAAGYTIPQYAEGVRQSAIWNYDRATQTVKPVWINPDGTALNVTIHYDAREPGFFFTGDPDAYAAKYGVDFIECTLTFVPIPWTVA
ncbi:unnamed protein product [Cyclocybe aegerita]|uniref:Uncharacterized protein n=1 Tax=Cyclocybe aegerita TaxID=1973307 RepID=A0A8S0W5K2_CYCAE|nr:unnamed protein product [Cyclocybe aegerita]